MHVYSGGKKWVEEEGRPWVYVTVDLPAEEVRCWTSRGVLVVEGRKATKREVRSSTYKSPVRKKESKAQPLSPTIPDSDSINFPIPHPNKKAPVKLDPEKLAPWLAPISQETRTVLTKKLIAEGSRPSPSQANNIIE